MGDDKELRNQLQRVAGLVRELEQIADPNVRSAAKELVQTVVDVHGAAFERILERIFQTGDTGQQLIDELGKDPLVGSLLVLYGLHPDELETRVSSALTTIKPALCAHGVEADLLSVQAGAVRLGAAVGDHACGSAAGTARRMLEEAIYEVAPDITSLVIEGLNGKSSSAGFVPLEKLLGSDAVSVAPAPTPYPAMAHPGGD